MAPKVADAAPVSTIRKLLAYRCLIDSEPWFVFWLHDEDIFGVTDAKNRVYEQQMTTTERKQLAGNVSESLLVDKWIKLFENRAFTLEFHENEDVVEVTYVRGSVNLKRVENDTVHERIADILNHSIGQMMSLSKKVAEFESKEKVKYLEKVAAKRSLYRPAPKTTVNARRKREQPTGLQFDD